MSGKKSSRKKVQNQVQKQEYIREAKTVKQILKDTMIQIFEVESKLAVVSAILSVVSIIVMYIFKGGVYVYQKGYYSYWNIPMLYIEIEYQHIIWSFIITLAVTIVFIAISYLYSSFFVNSKLGGRILLIAAIPILLFLFFIAYLILQFTAKEVLMTVILEWRVIAKGIATLSLVLYPMLFSTWGFFKLGSNKTREVNETEGKPKKQSFLHKNGNALICAYIVFALAVCTYQIYYSGNKNFRRKESVEIVLQNGQDYIIAGKNGEQWILKPCKIDEENDMIWVSRDNFKIENGLTDMIRVYKLNSKVEAQLKFDPNF